MSRYAPVSYTDQPNWARAGGHSAESEARCSSHPYAGGGGGEEEMEEVGRRRSCLDGLPVSSLTTGVLSGVSL